MNFWTPQTGENGNGWQYTYDASKIRGFKQTLQPSPRMNDYGMFSIMPVTRGIKVDENKRASWFSFNGKSYNNNWFDHKTLVQHCTINFEMTNQQNIQRGKGAESFPFSVSNEK